MKAIPVCDAFQSISLMISVYDHFNNDAFTIFITQSKTGFNKF